MFERHLSGVLVGTFMAFCAMGILWLADVRLSMKEWLFAMLLGMTWWGVSRLREETAILRARVEKGAPLTDDEEETAAADQLPAKKA